MSSWFPPPSKPRPVDGGLKARSARGSIALTWWSERFIAVLESIGVGGRLQRGRSYARKGQVVEMTLDAGMVAATVQGSRTRPYRVRIGLAAFGKAQWAQVTRTLADNAWYTARMLAGDMPDDIEDVFASVGLSLFPEGPDEVSMDCTCPDWEVPCKHIAAVFYLLAESFDEDPFGILTWRGRDQQSLLQTLSALRTGTTPADRHDRDEAVMPLSACLASYFVAQAQVPCSAVPASAPSDAALDQVPALDVAARGVNLVDVLRPVYLTLGRELGEQPAHGPKPHPRDRDFR